MVLDIIQKRFSVRNFSDKEVEDTKVKSILEAGILAPTWMNVQPWHFIVVKDKAQKELLWELSGKQKHVLNAPVLIACFGDVGAWDETEFSKILKQRNCSDEVINAIFQNPKLYPKKRGEDILRLRTMEQLTYGISYMTLEAVNQGLSSCVIGAVETDLTSESLGLYNKFKEQFKIPERLFLATVLAIGYEETLNLPGNKYRKSFNDVVSLNEYGKKYGE